MTPLALAMIVTLTWHAPTQSQTGQPLYGPLAWVALMLKGQAAAYRPGCEGSVACWDSVRVQDVPDTVAAGACMAGDSCSVALPLLIAGQFVVLSRTPASRLSAWSNVGRQP